MNHQYTQDDTFYMQRALLLAAKANRAVSPNPRVGCVIVKNKQVLGEGWHRQYQHAHAETEALAQAKNHAQGATAYVSLEPCAHHGHTPSLHQSTYTSWHTTRGGRYPRPSPSSKRKRIRYA